MSENPYYGYFKEVVGRGSGEYYTGIGQIYKSRRGIQRGYGNFVGGFPYGARRGLGLGSTLWSLFRMATPISKVLGSKAVDVVSNIAKDGIEGSNVKEAAKKHARAGMSDLFARMPKAFAGMMNKTGSGGYSHIIGSPAYGSVIPVSTPELAERALPVRRKRKKNLKTKNRTLSKRVRYPALQFM